MAVGTFLSACSFAYDFYCESTYIRETEDGVTTLLSWSHSHGFLPIRDPKAIAQAAEVNNPKRVYFLQKEVRNLTVKQLKTALNILLTLEFDLKRGVPDQIALQTKIVEVIHCLNQA